MKKIMFASTKESAGKSSIITGLMNLSGKKSGYMKPFGDRLIYRWKKSWDYDSNVITDIFHLSSDPEKITIGFDHSKLRYVYDAQSLKDKIDGMITECGAGRDLLFIEGGKDLFYGASLGLDSISVAKHAGAKLIFVVGGGNDSILDDIHFIKNYVDLKNADLGGIIINKVDDVDDFETVNLGEIKKLGIDVLGVIPYKEQLTCYTVSYLADKFFAKVIAGDGGLKRVIKNIFVGAMSTDESLRNPLFNKENKFLITSGDRSDMILAALDSDTVGILLTNNIIPQPSIVAKAEDRNIPLLLITADTFDASRQIDRLEALMTNNDTGRLSLLTSLISKYTDAGKILG